MGRFNHRILVLLLAAASVLFLGFRDRLTDFPFPILKHFPEMPDTDNSPSIEGAELGRHLFYDPILSADSTMSCASCHRQEAAFSDSPKRFSTGIKGEEMSRNTMPLFNLAWYPALFWDGKAKSIEEQVFHPVSAHNEMNLSWSLAAGRIQQHAFYRERFEDVFGQKDIDSVLISKAIGQFERTLISSNSKYDKVLRGETYFSPDEYEGFVLMNEQNKGNCLHCHTTDANALGTTGLFSNNGLSPAYSATDYADKGHAEVTGKEIDLGKFKIPSLRNVALTGPYMHDGSLETLEDVLDFYSEGVHPSLNVDSKLANTDKGGMRLTQEEKRKIISFLHTMTDSTFIIDKRLSNPFISR